jgi:predicted MPP superfamily phosphohydrolase
MQPPPTRATPVNRRTFLRRALQGGLALTGLAGLTVVYGLAEASWIRVLRQTVALPHLPPAFEGKTIAVLADFHHGPFVTLPFIRRAVALAQSLKADLYALVGDFAHRGKHTAEQMPPCLEALSGLEAPLGVFAVPGNHDVQDEGRVYRETVRATPLTDLTNRAVRVQLDGQTLWMAGVDDLWWGKPDLAVALRDVPAGEALVVLSHNPDVIEINPDPRVGLMLSGHTHGGQVCLPGYGAVKVPSRFGRKYAAGLVRGPVSPVFVSRGLGLAGVPLRISCPPEINLLTLTVDR